MFLYAMYTSSLRLNSAGSSLCVPQNRLKCNTHDLPPYSHGSLAAVVMAVGRCPLFEIQCYRRNFADFLSERRRYCLTQAPVAVESAAGICLGLLMPCVCCLGSFINTLSVSKLSSSGSGSFRAASREV